MVHPPEASRHIAQNPVFAQKARRVASRHGAEQENRRFALPRIGLQGIVRTALALWCIKIAVVTAQGPTAQTEMVARLENVSPVAATLAAPDPLTRNALALRYKFSDWKRDLEQIF